MQIIITQILSSPYFSLITFVIGVLLTIFFHHKSKRTKSLKYVLKTNNLFKDHSSKLSGLEVKYKEEAVKDLSITKLMFWNAGKETINGQDITELDPLSIKVDNGIKILEALLIKDNNQASKIELINYSENKYSVKFDYLDQLDGAVVNIIHTGLSSKGIGFGGKIKGIRKISKSSIPQSPKRIQILVPIPIQLSISKYNAKKRRFLYGLSQISIGIVWALLILISKYLEMTFPDSSFVKSNVRTSIPMWVIILPTLLFIGNGLYIITRKIPQDIDVYEDE